MKHIIVFIVLITGFISCTQSVKGRNGVVYKSAVQYNDYIIDKQKILQKNAASMGEVSQTNPDSAYKMLDKNLLEIESMIVDLEGMPAYKNDSSMRDAAISTFKFYKKIFSEDYKQILDIRKEGGAGTDEGVAKMSAIVDNITRQEDGYDKTFHNAQKDFADKNHMKLAESTWQEKNK